MTYQYSYNYAPVPLDICHEVTCLTLLFTGIIVVHAHMT